MLGICDGNGSFGNDAHHQIGAKHCMQRRCCIRAAAHHHASLLEIHLHWPCRRFYFSRAMDVAMDDMLDQPSADASQRGDPQVCLLTVFGVSLLQCCYEERMIVLPG